MEVRDLFNLGKCKHIAIAAHKCVELSGGGSRVNIILTHEFCLDFFLNWCKGLVEVFTENLLTVVFASTQLVKSLWSSLWSTEAGERHCVSVEV